MEGSRIGVRDMMERNRFKPSHLQKSLIEKEIPGRWKDKTGLQNVYNLINGKVMPKDGYVFIFLADFLQVKLSDVLKRFTVKKEENEQYKGESIQW